MNKIICSFLEKILSKFKKVFSESNNPNQQVNPNGELYERIQPGDVVFCRMTLDQEELMMIPEGHRERPYLIVSKNEGSLIGYACTTNPFKRAKNYELFCFKRKGYLNKENERVDSYVGLNKAFTLSIDDLKFYMFSIKDYEMRRIQKLISINQNHTPETLPHFHISFSLSEGDLILYNQKKYYVTSVDGEKIYCFLVHRKRGNDTDVHIMQKGSFSYVDVTEKTCILMDNEIKVIYMCSSNEIKGINTKKNRIKEHTKKSLSNAKQKNVFYFFKYVPGTILESRFSQEEYVYLFSTRKKSYGLNVKKGEEGQLQVEEINLEYLEYVDELEDDCKKNIFFDLIRSHTSSTDILQDIYNKNFIGTLI